MIPNLSKSMIDILQQLRKRLRSEFGVELRLSQPDIVTKISQLIEKTRDQKSLLLFADFEDMMGVDLSIKMKSTLQQSHSAENIGLVYKGQVKDSPLISSEISKENAQITKRIYRGRVVL
jgi:hypothetical protein